MSNKKRILLVEDDPNFGIILRDFLKMNEYDVILAKNGMEGFEKFKKFEFNLCILDVMMPYKDGFTLATEIKAISPDMPIIFLTAKSMKEDVLKGYKVGADDYLKKPFDSDIHKKYVNHENIENLVGLEVELIYEWEVGSMLIFDRTNIHCSSSVIDGKKIGLPTFTKK